MTRHAARTDQPVAAPHVWGRLSTDLQVRVVRLLAQLAYACATTRVQHSGKETKHAAPSDDLQDPPRPS